jgi:hypothetical protein
MKLENIQTHVTNPQFSGGRPIGSGSYTGNSSFAKANIVFTGIATTTGSFNVVSTFGDVTSYQLTSSNQATASAAGNYIAIGASPAATITNIATFLNASSSVVSAVGNSLNLGVTASINGTAGNSVQVISGSTTTNLSGGVGRTDYPVNFPFVAGGLYVGQIGDLEATTLDGSVLTFFSASGFIPGLFTGVSAFPATTALGVIALK